MAGRSRQASGSSIRITSTTHAQVVLACETLGMTVSEFMERAALASLQRQEAEDRVQSYRLACSAAEAARRGMPSPEAFGLPRDFGVATHG